MRGNVTCFLPNPACHAGEGLVIAMTIHWLPYRRLTLYSPLSPDEAAQALSGRVIRRRYHFWTFADAGQFEGEISVYKFNFNHRLWYQNSWRPIVYGTFEPLDNGTHIHITIKTHPLSTFISIWCFGLFAFALSNNAWTAISSGNSADGLVFPIVCLLVLPYLGIILAFNYEANKAIQFLHNAFGSQNTPPM